MIPLGVQRGMVVVKGQEGAGLGALWIAYKENNNN